MELLEYLRIIKKGGKRILLWGAVAALIAFVYSYFRGEYYDVSLALSVSRASTQQTQDYQYDGYYIIQASELFTDTVKQWINSPEVVANVYKEAGIDSEAKSLKELQKKFKADKLSSQYLEVKFTVKEEETAKKISGSLLNVLQSKAYTLGWASRSQATFSILGAEPIIMKNKADLLVNTLIGLLVGLFIGISVAFFGNYTEMGHGFPPSRE